MASFIRTVRGGPTPEVDRYLLSYPKSGRTWLRALIGRALVARFRLPEERLMETEDLVRAAQLPSFAFDHDGSSMMDACKGRRLSPDKSAFRGKHVLLLGRDVRDTLVSAYFHATRRLGIYEGTISSFIRDERYGADKVIAFYRQWFDARSVPRTFVFLRYEALHEDAPAALRATLDFLGARDVPASTIDDAIRFASFDNLRRAEAADAFRSASLRAANPADPESYKVRRGKIGGYVDYLSPADIAYIDEREAESGCEFARPCRTPAE